MSNRKHRRNPNQGRGAVTAGPGGSGSPIGPDDLVFGTAKQLREMAAAMQRGDPTARNRTASAAAGRVRAYQDRHPDADLAQLVGRPRFETAVAPAPAERPGPRPVTVRTAASGAAELWVDDYIEPPNMWGEGVSARSIREALDECGTRDVVVHMNSGGGDYFEGVGIYQALRQHPGHVYIAVDALAASAASVVTMAGDTVGIGDGAFIMIHEASAFAYGSADDLLTIADMLDGIGDEISGFYARRGVHTAAEFRTAMRTETWYGPAAAIAAGLADESLNPPATDPQALDPGDDPAAQAVADLFAFARPANTTPPPAPADPGPAPDPDPVDWSALFRDDDTELFT